MPNYDYKCELCNHLETFTHGMSEKLTPKCSECTGVMRKTFTAPSTVFKGQGFASNER